MSPNKSWQLRTYLTLGAAALALGMTGSAGIAAGHGREAMGAMRGAGNEAARNTSERFESVAVVRLPAPVFRGPATGYETPRVITESPGAPVATSPRKFIEPRVIPRFQPDKMPNGPAADAQQPSPAARGLIQDPVAPSTDMRQRSTDLRQPSTDLRQPSTDLRQPLTDLRQPSIDAKGPIADPLRPVAAVGSPSLNEGQPSTDAQRLILDPVQPSATAHEPTTVGRGVARDPVLPSPDHVVVQQPAAN